MARLLTTISIEGLRGYMIHVSQIRCASQMFPMRAVALAAAAAFAFSFAFTVAFSPPNGILPTTPNRGRWRYAPPTYHLSQSLLLHSHRESNGDVFLLSIDGTLTSTCRSRSWMAISVALRVWPQLQLNMEALGINHETFSWEHNVDRKCDSSEEEESYEWLLQKLSALSSITQQGNSQDAMMGCDAVLLALRLLIEEQQLDGGRSNGRGGKYGGKFHPSSTSSSNPVATGERSTVGSRPLTVGEIYANWYELRDVTRMKYPFIGDTPEGVLKVQDPLPKIQHCLKEFYSMAQQNGTESKILPSWQPLAYDTLFDHSTNGPRQNTMLLLGHESQIPMALKTLSLLGELDVEVTTSNKAWKLLTDNSADRSSLLLVVPEKEETQSKMIEKLTTDINANSDTDHERNVFVMHSSLEVLKQCKSFLGDDA